MLPKFLGGLVPDEEAGEALRVPFGQRWAFKALGTALATRPHQAEPEKPEMFLQVLKTIYISLGMLWEKLFF